MEYALAPLAKACGAGDKRKDLTRFSEQGWLIVFYTVFWPLGMVGSTTSRPAKLNVLTFLVHLLQLAVLPQLPGALDRLAHA